MLRRIVTSAVLTGLLMIGAASGARAQQVASIGLPASNSSGWIFNVAPYGWLPSINGSLNYSLPPALAGKVSTDVSAGPADILSHLNFATMIAAEAQYDRFSVLTDLLYMSVSGTNSHFKSLDFFGLPSEPISRSLQFSTGTRLGSTIWTLAGGYTLVQGDWGNLDAIAGFRYFAVNATTNYSVGLKVTGPQGNGQTFGGFGGISGSANIWNGIGGLRGRIRISNTGFFIPYYFDIGAGGSQLTWQVASGLGYQTGWAGVSLTYRYLSFEQGNTSLVKNLSLGGPMVMVNFTF